ncbi:MAG: cytochrome C peroxidase [Acidobacteria bacterium]|nr:cytochrome C peroxidase [Acidobacteriota bacterium]
MGWPIVPAAQLRTEPGIRSLKTVTVPPPTGVEAYVRDFRVLVVLGKALFWDVQAGSDNRTACATCHFHAGADHRRQNQLASTPDTARAVPLNRVLTIDDFPFYLFEDQNNRASRVVRDTRLIAGSAGVPLRQFVDISRDGTPDHGADPDSLPAPAVGGLKIRQATTRNTPSVINAAFNVRNFHDGRASRTFTGRTPFGESDTAMNGLMLIDGVLQPHRVRMENASLASQAMGPPLNQVEMSYAGRTWPKLGKKMLPLVALGTQAVAQDDSVLGEFANAEGLGLRPDNSYAALVRAAFKPEFWESSAVVDADGRVIDGVAEPRSSDEFTQAEFNFPIFWGIAVQAYQATLISDDTRFDRYAEGNGAVLTDQELAGLNEFLSDAAKCSQCHGGPEFTAASFTHVAARGFDASRPDAFGFFRIGVSPMADDIGAGGTDGFGIPLFPAASHDSASGVFKAPGLRNVELTGPYFHTGGSATLEQVMAFYNRRGDLREGGNLDPGFLEVELGSRSGERLTAFLKTLTDDRVRYERAPFDHPALCVPTGHPEAAPGVLLPDGNAPGEPVAGDTWVLVPAVGRRGSQVPLQTFEELLLGIGNDGSRAHTMIAPCNPGEAPAGRPR